MKFLQQSNKPVKICLQMATLMETEQKREVIIMEIAEMLRHTHFTCEFKVVKKPKGIRIVTELTQEQMNKLMEKQKKQ